MSSRSPTRQDRDRAGAMLMAATPASPGSSIIPNGRVRGSRPKTTCGVRSASSGSRTSHLQLVHMLNLRYTFAKPVIPTRAATLRALGRPSGYLFHAALCARAKRPSSTRVSLSRQFSFRSRRPAPVASQSLAGSPREQRRSCTCWRRACGGTERLDLPRPSTRTRRSGATGRALQHRPTHQRQARDGTGRGGRDRTSSPTKSRRLELVLRAISRLPLRSRPVNSGAVEASRPNP